MMEQRRTTIISSVSKLALVRFSSYRQRSTPTDKPLGSTKRKVLPPLRPGSNLPDGSTARIYNAFHMLANPKSAELHIKELNEFLSLHKDHKKPLLVWEADPDFCDPQNRAKHLEACKLFDVFCIGSRELMSMFDAESESRQSFDLSMVGFAKQFLEAGSANPDDGPSEPGEGPHEASEDSSDSGNGIKIVVPAGKYGCLIMWKADKWRWLEPWYKAGSDQIIDATGTNNAFVGAFTVSMQRGDNFIEAACCGIIAASFAIQQDGLPSVDWVDGVEMWNGENFVARLQKYREELNKHMLNRDL